MIISIGWKYLQGLAAMAGAENAAKTMEKSIAGRERSGLGGGLCFPAMDQVG